MNPQDLEFIKQQEHELRLAQLEARNNSVNNDVQAAMLREEQTNLMKEQLSLGEELDIIEHLLKGDVLKRNEHGITVWSSPDDPSTVILTEYGVHLIMNTVMFYLNKNTLLSNYDEVTILHKMEDFSTDLADTVFMEYEKVFKYPSLKECRKVLVDRINRKTELREFSYQLAGIKKDREEIREEFIDEIENRIENEIDKIKEQIIKNKLKRFVLLIREVQDSVHSTYLRAWNGQERRTLRQHIHVSETNNPSLNNLARPQRQVRPQGLFKR